MVFASFAAMAQVTPPPLPKDTAKPAPVATAPPPVPFPDTNIRIVEQPAVRNTVQKLNDYQRYSHGTSPGYRVQIDFGQERTAVNKTKSDFLAKYPNIPVYIAYKQPYFKVSVGDCRKRLDAARLLNTLKKDYPAAFIVAERIVPPPL